MFNRSSFSSLSFSLDSFYGSSSKSGYWRLFFYNLQEEALKKKEPSAKSKEVVLVKEEPRKPVETQKISQESYVEPLYSKPIFKPLPTVEKPNKELEETLLSTLWSATLFIRQVMGVKNMVKVERAKTGVKKPITYDEEEALLLLISEAAFV